MSNVRTYIHGTLYNNKTTKPPQNYMPALHLKSPTLIGIDNEAGFPHARKKSSLDFSYICSIDSEEEKKNYISGKYDW